MDSHIRLASFLTKLLDTKFNIFGFRFGLDPIIGLIPVIGDMIGLLLSLYVVWIAMQLQLPNRHIVRMLVNVLADYLIGLIPVIGDLFDIGFKANTRNFKILEDHLTSH